MLSRLKLAKAGLGASDLRRNSGGFGLQGRKARKRLLSVGPTHRGAGARGDVEERHSTLGAVGKREMLGH